MALPPALLDELIEEILLRLPPDDPACLVHTALVCKPWCRLVSDPRFRRRYHELHGAAMLGFFGTLFTWKTKFVSTSTFRPPHVDDRFHDCKVIDARHGRVLVYDSQFNFMVWDRLLDRRIALPRTPVRFLASWNAAVICAASTTCNHLDCNHGPFLVVILGETSPERISISVYSSEDGYWSDPTVSSGLHMDANLMHVDCVCALVGNAVYFSLWNARNIIQYKLGTRQVSFTQLPPTSAPFALMTGEDGGLGLACVDDNFRLCIWLREDVRDGDAGGWVQSRAIKLKGLLPDSSVFSTLADVVGVADGVGVVFLQTDDGTFTIDLKSGHATKVSAENFIFVIHPYMSFYPPVRGLAFGSEGPSTCASGA